MNTSPPDASPYSNMQHIDDLYQAFGFLFNVYELIQGSKLYYINTIDIIEYIFYNFKMCFFHVF